jgi:hypothetical protein
MNENDQCEATFTIQVSAGEQLDRVSILRLKAERLSSASQLACVLRELSLLEEAHQHFA